MAHFHTFVILRSSCIFLQFHVTIPQTKDEFLVSYLLDTLLGNNITVCAGLCSLCTELSIALKTAKACIFRQLALYLRFMYNI
mmetsp:Transcript_22899/g.41238  ORF Transcript_22899/g.41238 Transcript_22899/m.41238 type:complete len:83 (+) Transcript_22899:1886-2134(+)